MLSSSKKSYAILFNASEVERLGNNICDEMLVSIQKQLSDDDIDFTGDLSQSFHRSRDGNFKTVETKNPYAWFVEHGLPSGTKVNFGALRIWVEGKLNIIEGDELEHVTWKIFHKIVSTGIRPRRYMKKAIKRFIGKYGQARAKISKQQRIWNKRDRLLKKAFRQIRKAWRIRNKQLKIQTKQYKQIKKSITKSYKSLSRSIRRGMHG